MLMELVTTVKAMEAELQKKEDDLQKKEDELRWFSFTFHLL